MCGIVGVFAPTANAAWKSKTFRRLLCAAQDRGTDATGYAYVDDSGKTVIEKDGVKALKFVHENPRFLELMEKANKEGSFPNLIIGHARGATKGTDTGPEKNTNNHPFFAEQVGVTMIHNGLISNDDDWRDTVGKELGLLISPDSPVDSEVMLRAVETFLMRHGNNENRGMMEAIDDACYCVAGSYSLAFLKQDQPNSLWLVKHKNPLHIAWVPSKKAIVFASTQEMIDKSLTHEKIILDYFVDTQETAAVVNTMAEDTMIQIDYTGTDGKEFNIEVVGLDCATGPGRTKSDMKADVKDDDVMLGMGAY